MELVAEIHESLGLEKKPDRELARMQRPTNIEHLTEAAQTVEDNNSTHPGGK